MRGWLCYYPEGMARGAPGPSETPPRGDGQGASGPQRNPTSTRLLVPQGDGQGASGPQRNPIHTSACLSASAKHGRFASCALVSRPVLRSQKAQEQNDCSGRVRSFVACRLGLRHCRGKGPPRKKILPCGLPGYTWDLGFYRDPVISATRARGLTGSLVITRSPNLGYNRGPGITGPLVSRLGHPVNPLPRYTRLPSGVQFHLEISQRRATYKVSLVFGGPSAS
jgi:hypothetical protein